MAKKDITRFLLTSDLSDLDKIVRKFFIKRFKRQPEDDPGYYHEWLMRFRRGTPDVFMDSDSKRVWNKLKKTI